MRLKDKVSIITGAGRGIGQATALKFAREGARVVVSDVGQEAVDETVDKVRAEGGEALGFVVDVTRRPEISQRLPTLSQTLRRSRCAASRQALPTIRVIRDE